MSAATGARRSARTARPASTDASRVGPVAVCLKWVDRRAQVDPLAGTVHTDRRTSGASDADLGALELGLRLAERWSLPLRVVSAAGADADPMLRDALAVGAGEALRIDLPAPAPSATVAAALAGALGDATLVLCGAWSLDRGSGAVPAFLAAELGAAQALGLVGLEVGPGDTLVGERRIDRGGRERLELRPPAVVSLEAGVARLRRAGLDAVRAAAGAEVTVVGPPPGTGGQRPGSRGWQTHPGGGGPLAVGPYRPRTHVVAPPEGATARQRVLALSGAGATRSPARTLQAGPDEAARVILEQLRAWGYLE